MKAILMTAPGAAESLQYADIPLPELPSPAHLRVRLKAAGVNPVDTKLRKAGTYYPDKLPTILGCDGAGVVESVGAAVRRFKVGDEVYFCHGGIGGEPGNYAEYAVLHEEYAAAKPRTLSMTEAAAVPLALITAWESLFDRALLKSGETVLIHAAAGGVGHLAVQLAQQAGARVAATVSGAEKAALVRELGAEKTIDYRNENVPQAVLDWTNGQGAAVVFDTVGGETWCQSFAATKVYGRVVTLLQSTCEASAMKIARTRNLSLSYELMLTPMFLGLHEARIAQRRILEEGARRFDSGQLKVIVRHTFPLANAAEAHRLIEEGHATGKIVLEIAG